MDNEDIRWKQRFQNFEKTVRLLQSAVEVEIRQLFLPLISSFYQKMEGL